MTLSLIRSAIAPYLRGLSADGWIEAERVMGDKVRLFRDYVDGDHRANLTPEMRRMLRIADAGSLNEFNVNYCPIIVSTMVDRLTLLEVRGDNDAATAWAADLFKQNRLDALQTDVHNATVRDGRSFLLVDMDVLPDESRRVRFTHEPAYDGTYGVIPFYATDADRTPLFAVKLWRLSRKGIGDTVRVNVYHADRIERYITTDENAASLIPYTDDGQPAVVPWVLPDGSPIGVPVIPLENRDGGLSEIENVIPLQDVANRTLYSMTMTAELTAFAVRALIGASAPSAITPGMILSYFAKDINGNMSTPDATAIEWLKSIRLDQWPAAELTGFIEQQNWLRDQIFEITNTPTESAADAASGESLKQREIKLLGKVARFQVRNGNAWEDAFALAHRVQQAFGTVQPPAYTELTARWKDAQVRNKSEIIALANAVKDQVPLKVYYELIAEVFDWSPEKIDEMVADKKTEQQEEIRASVRGVADAAFNRKPQQAAA